MDLTLFETLKSKLGLATVGKPALIGMAAVIVMVAVLAGRFLFDTATATEIEIAHSDESANVENLEGTEEGSGSAQAVDHDIFVYVSGAVNEPGLVRLKSGGRLAEAIQVAGGFAEDAATESVNLARQAIDGEQVHVLRASGDVDEAPVQDAVVSTAEQRMAGANGAVSGASGLLNINLADAQQLESLPGIGPSTARKIVADREASGPFASVDDLTRVSGIGDKKLDAIRDMICV